MNPEPTAPSTNQGRIACWKRSKREICGRRCLRFSLFVNLAAVGCMLHVFESAAAEVKPATNGRVVMRCLNRVEYENTVRDLLGVKVDLKELLTVNGPRDGFDNVGEALHISSFLMEKYLEAADKALNVAIANGPQPKRIKRRYSLKETHQVKSTQERVFLKSPDDHRVVMFSSSRWQAVSLTPFYPKDRGDYRFSHPCRGCSK